MAAVVNRTIYTIRRNELQISLYQFFFGKDMDNSQCDPLKYVTAAVLLLNLVLLHHILEISSTWNYLVRLHMACMLLFHVQQDRLITIRGL